MDDGVAELHLAVCRRFGQAVASADGKWDRRSPCEAWDARAVLEHVIGFHDVLLLRPLGLKPHRPDDPQARWQLTYASLTAALESGSAAELDAYRLMPNLTRDVLVHCWDLARAVGADDRLDARWCELCYAGLPVDPRELAASGMFGAPVAPSSDSDVQAKLLARLGRDPAWQPERTSS
ncbi:maleylpyruvate isomerase family mycothiol-dependent enzyme [Mycobacterium sp. Aquia_213]|uniref:maleylpyruvate isomerase family mycothiol-dependent enzyme n=1 Tax=Mycobacterium sp. Aquia_213 TaxID=2991728 RepID=UPI00226FA0A0|nr:maleylpyruvate isomerase family mycothiol-dependent enzyme [Mycobacterium sp. Aquia_213]WAC93106.1 maleylpyruvate isomerase family mycothiol-dependent enzyme [Mycobacterium sp. Aquia_213]